jgi:hypothetical protein
MTRTRAWEVARRTEARRRSWTARISPRSNSGRRCARSAGFPSSETVHSGRPCTRRVSSHQASVAQPFPPPCRFGTRLVGLLPRETAHVGLARGLRRRMREGLLSGLLIAWYKPHYLFNNVWNNGHRGRQQLLWRILADGRQNTPTRF